MEDLIFIGGTWVARSQQTFFTGGLPVALFHNPHPPLETYERSSSSARIPRR